VLNGGIVSATPTTSYHINKCARRARTHAHTSARSWFIIFAALLSDSLRALVLINRARIVRARRRGSLFIGAHRSSGNVDIVVVVNVIRKRHRQTAICRLEKHQSKKKKAKSILPDSNISQRHIDGNSGCYRASMVIALSTRFIAPLSMYLDASSASHRCRSKTSASPR